MSAAVLSLLTLCFVSLVYGLYLSKHFIYKGQVQYNKRESAIKEIFVPNDASELIYCGLQCVREPKCLAIELCLHEDQQLCRLCNSTNSSFTENKTYSCRHLQLDYMYERNQTETCSKDSVVHTCKDILNNANGKVVSSGVYSIDIDCKPTDVWCDMETDGGGWTVIQRRQSGITDFYRSWNEYKSGFGNMSDEYWIGNDALHILTTSRNVTLRADLEQFNGDKSYGVYTTFRVDNETEKYRLSISGYNGTINDCLTYHNGLLFSTKERDNDQWSVGNCAVARRGGWWYRNCATANLNGPYSTSSEEGYTSVYFYSSTGVLIALKRTLMMIR